jgi:PIN domain nuclease of toxin-antitoxin system
MARDKKSIVYLDTHIVVWLYDKLLDKFSKKAKDIINDNDLYISQLTILELQYLYEIGRIRNEAQEIINELKYTMGLNLSNLSFDAIVSQALNINWTRDVFDRLIVAEAYFYTAPLITADRKIHKKYKKSCI